MPEGKVLFAADITISIPRIEVDSWTEALDKVKQFMNNVLSREALESMTTDISIFVYEEEE
jgi:hypothetical protein